MISSAIIRKSVKTAKTNPARDEDRPSAFFEAARVSSVGLEMGVSILAGWGLGYYLDSQLGTDPWLMLVGLLFGVAAGFNGLLQTAKRVNRQQRLDAEGIES